MLVTHDEGAVEALDPERVLLLPDGDEDLWSPATWTSSRWPDPGPRSADRRTTRTRERSGAAGQGSRITGEGRDDLAGSLVERYERGESIRSIADGIGRSYGFVHGVLAASEVACAGAGCDPRRGRRGAPGVGALGRDRRPPLSRRRAGLSPAARR